MLIYRSLVSVVPLYPVGIHPSIINKFLIIILPNFYLIIFAVAIKI